MAIDVKDVKCVLFDWGGVLIENPAEELLHGVSQKKGLAKEYLENFLEIHLEKFQKGVLEEAELWKKLSHQLKVEIPLEPVWGEVASSCFKEKQEVLDWVKILVEKDLKIGLLSNTEKPTQSVFYKKNWDLNFDFLFFSSELGMIKPNEDIYAHVEKVTGFSGSQLLFLDDKPENLEIPQEKGWQTFLFNHDKTFQLMASRFLQEMNDENSGI